jgi:chemotaxis protein methyltransferase CheR
MVPSNDELLAFELDLFLKAVLFRYGYDFSHYAQASLIRRVNNCMEKSGVTTISSMISKVLHDKSFFNLFLEEMSVTVTEMFRDPFVFKAIKENVFSQLETYSRINIWHAGCATGEEVYSLAIMLKEVDLLSRCQIYATDYNNKSLEIAAQGKYKAEKIPNFTRNYLLAGGKASFADYYDASHRYAEMDDSLKAHITFANHNLTKDHSFAQMHLIICRNVLIYFDKQLQNQVLSLFKESLLHRGYLILGDKESLKFSNQQNNFTPLIKGQSIYQKVCFE